MFAKTRLKPKEKQRLLNDGQVCREAVPRIWGLVELEQGAKTSQKKIALVGVLVAFFFSPQILFKAY